MTDQPIAPDQPDQPDQPDLQVPEPPQPGDCARTDDGTIWRRTGNPTSPWFDQRTRTFTTWEQIGPQVSPGQTWSRGQQVPPEPPWLPPEAPAPLPAGQDREQP